MSLEVQKTAEILKTAVIHMWDLEVLYESEKLWDFELPRHFSIAILATKTALKHQLKSPLTLANPKKTY